MHPTFFRRPGAWWLLSLLTALLPGRASAQAPTYQWATTCGSMPRGDDNIQAGPTELAVDALGNTYVLGSYMGTIALGNFTLTAEPTAPNGLPPRNIYVAKLDAQGSYQWAQSVGGSGVDYGKGIALDAAGNVYITGYFFSFSIRVGAGGPVLFNSSARQELFVAKLDGQSGRCVWARRAGGVGGDGGVSVAIAPSGEVYLTGYTGGDASFGSFILAIGAFVAKLDAAGNWLWAVRGNGAAESTKIVVDAVGNAYVAGEIYGVPPYAIRFGNTAPLVGAQTPGYQPYAYDGFVAKISPAGVWRWAVQGNATGLNLARIQDMSLDRQGNLFVVGNYEGTSARFGATTLPNLSQVAPPPNPLPPIPYTSYYSDAFVARLDTAGRWQWAVRAGGPTSDVINSVTADAQGRVYVSAKQYLGLGYVNTFLDPLGGSNAQPMSAAQLDASTGRWRWTSRDISGVVAVGGLGEQLHIGTFFTGPAANFGNQTLTGVDALTGVVARLGGAPLAAAPPTAAGGGLFVWPNPATGPTRTVSVSGPAAGAGVRVFDVLGRLVSQATMPPRGLLTLTLPGSLAPGVYLVRSGEWTQRLAVE